MASSCLLVWESEEGGYGTRGVSISLRSSCGAMISLISVQLWSLSGSQVARALKKTDRKRVAAREEEQLEIGARVAQHIRLGEREKKVMERELQGRKSWWKSLRLRRKTTCPHVVPRSTGSDNIVHISVIRAGFLVLWHVGLLADKDKARGRGETSDVVSSYSNDSHLKFKIKLCFQFCVIYDGILMFQHKRRSQNLIKNSKNECNRLQQDEWSASFPARLDVCEGKSTASIDREHKLELLLPRTWGSWSEKRQGQTAQVIMSLSNHRRLCSTHSWPLTAPRDVMNRSCSRRPQEKSTTGTRLPQSTAVMKAFTVVILKD